MYLDQVIEFPNLGIRIEHVWESFTLFGDVDITIYGALIGVAILAGYLITRWQAARTGQDQELYLDFALYAVIFSLIGARIYYVAFSWEKFQDNPIQILNFRGGGLAIYGGILTAILFTLLYSKWKKQSFWQMADTGTMGLLMGQIIGRWGNFFSREAFGTYTNTLFAMRLSLSEVLRSSVTEEMLKESERGGYVGFIQVHPIFLYESLWNLVLFLLLFFLTKRKHFEGELFLLYLVGYGAGRFWMEELRTDQLYFWGTDFSINQIISGILVAGGCLVWIVRLLRTREKRK